MWVNNRRVLVPCSLPMQDHPHALYSTELSEAKPVCDRLKQQPDCVLSAWISFSQTKSQCLHLYQRERERERERERATLRASAPDIEKTCLTLLGQTEDFSAKFSSSPRVRTDPQLQVCQKSQKETPNSKTGKTTRHDTTRRTHSRESAVTAVVLFNDSDITLINDDLLEFQVEFKSCARTLQL